MTTMLPLPTTAPFANDEQRYMFAEANPWRVTGEMPEHMVPAVERSLASGLAKLAMSKTTRRFHLLVGPRRIGKTTALLQTVRALLREGVKPSLVAWLQLDRPELKKTSLGEITNTLIKLGKATRSEPLYLFLDEVNYAEDWQQWIKVIHDANQPVRIIATSSSAPALIKGKQDAFIGRCEEHHMLQCGLPEFLQIRGYDLKLPSPQTTFGATLRLLIQSGWKPPGECAAFRRRLMVVGGYPELLASNVGNPETSEDEAGYVSRRTLRTDAIERAIYRDVSAFGAVGSITELERVFNVLAAQSGGIFSPENVSRQMGVTKPTIDRWVHLLDQTMLCFSLTGFSGREASVQKRGRKLYLADPALKMAALSLTPRALEDPIHLGALIENQAIAQLWAASKAAKVRVHYWRNRKGEEVDAVYDEAGDPCAFEVATSGGHHLKGMEAFRASHSTFKDGCYLVVADAGECWLPTETKNGIGRVTLDVFLAACWLVTARDWLVWSGAAAG